jgi:hypothetical protein
MDEKVVLGGLQDYDLVTKRIIVDYLEGYRVMFERESALRAQAAASTLRTINMDGHPSNICHRPTLTARGRVNSTRNGLRRADWGS